jgi:tetratricopeptide (TPR) repeat protein
MINCENLLEQGLLLKKQGEYKKALDLYLNVQPELSNDSNLYNGLGDIYYILGDYENSINSYLKVLKLHVNIDFAYLKHLGHALLDEASMVDVSDNINKYQLSKDFENACYEITVNNLKPIINKYRCSIDTYFAEYIIKPSEKLSLTETVHMYDNICTSAARYYINTPLCKNRLLSL